MLDDELLAAFMLGFYGYGSFSAPIWFVGMEEGGGNSADEIADRLTAWDQGGRSKLEDVVQYHEKISAVRSEVARFWKERPVLQPTWGRLIRVLLSAQGRPATTETVKAFQRHTWGRQQSDAPTCLLELFPLPSPSTARWLYASISALPYLANRQTYRQQLAAECIQRIKAHIAEHQPRAVVFYGLAYQKYWQTIAGEVMAWDATNGIFIGQHNATIYIATKHPAARGVTNAYFEAVGQQLNVEGVRQQLTQWRKTK